MKKKMDKNGYGNYEFLTVTVICFILSVILLICVFASSNEEKIQVFKYDAKILGLNAVFLESEINHQVIYLEEMIDKGYISEIKNPFYGMKLCNAQESKVEIINNERKVTLQCGNYLIYYQNLNNENYEIYRVSSWTTNKSKNIVEEKAVYNLKMDNQFIFDISYEQELFIHKVNQYLGTDYQNLKSIQNKYEVVSTMLYRTKEKIK